MKAIGLMAGTSLDGIDAALVDLKRTGKGVAVELLAFETYPYNGETVRYILECSDPATASVDKVARLNFYLGELFGEAALKIMKQGGVAARDVEFIGSHGQTIHHLPAPVKMGRYRIRATCQVAEPSVIAARSGVTTVADFRPADIAAGGQGAPLVPYVDHLLFHDPRRTRFLVNIGGIANGTVLIKGNDDPLSVQASDIGPGNMVINELVCRMTNHKETYDRDGRHAALGKSDPKLLAGLLATAFFAEPPPKSTGRERFGAKFVDDILKSHPAETKKQYRDLIATATDLTAHAIHGHYRKFHAAKASLDEVIVSGGGARNLYLMQKLADLFAPAPMASSSEYGIPALAKEAIAFAILAMETLKGRPGNLPGATGAKKTVILGKIVPAP
ncbi:MAG TPA: anhydro-N-acetylmuramic acid kinase [bacterium]|nr:anhydro-N-acetylmuramic acid kinase [bacterium]